MRTRKPVPPPFSTLVRQRVLALAAAEGHSLSSLAQKMGRHHDYLRRKLDPARSGEQRRDLKVDEVDEILAALGKTSADLGLDVRWRTADPKAIDALAKMEAAAAALRDPPDPFADEAASSDPQTDHHQDA